MDTALVVLIALIVFLLPLGSAVALGFVTQNAWVGVVTGAGILFLFLAIVSIADERRPKKGAYLLCVVASLWLIGMGTWLAQFVGRWLWAPVWFMEGFMLLGSGTNLNQREKSWIGYLANVLGILAMIFAILGPAWLFARIPTNVSLPAAPPAEETAITATPDIGATQIAGAVQTATAMVITETPSPTHTPSATPTPKQTPTPTLTPDIGATEIAGAIATATAEAGGETAPPAPSATPVVAEPSDEESPPAGRQVGSIGDGIQATGGFLWAVIRTFWGWVYLLCLFLWGQIILKKWGGLLAIVLLLLTTTVLGWQGMPALETVQQVMTSSPAAEMQFLLNSSLENNETVGWTILLAGLGFSTIMIPAYRLTYRSNVEFQVVNKLQERLGTAFAQRYWASNKGKIVRVLGASFLSVAVGFGLPIALWVGLRRIVGDGSPDALPFYFVPNLAQPSWKPVFHYGYFALAAILGALNATVGEIQKRNKLSGVFAAYQNPVSTVIGSLLLSLFVPAGVLLYMMGLVLGQTATISLVLLERQQSKRKKRSQRTSKRRSSSSHRRTSRKKSSSSYRPPSQRPKPKPTPPRPKPAPKPTPKPKPAPTPKPKPKPKPQPKRAGVFLFKTKSSMVDFAIKSWGTTAQNAIAASACYGLQEKKRILLVQDKKILAQEKLSLAEPLGLLTVSETDLLVIDAQGKLVQVGYDDDAFEVNGEMETPIPVGSFALNPYGSMLAYTNSDSTELHGMFLGPKQDQILAQDISDPVALAFAHSGRFVAVGSKSGTVHVVDIATRQAAHLLEPTDFDISPVQHLCAGPDGTWIVAYKDNWLARWSADGELMDSRKLPSTAVCIAVAAKGGQVAYGSRAGYIRVRSADFSDLLFKEHVHLKQIQKIIMAEQGDMLMALDTASSVRWVNL